MQDLLCLHPQCTRAVQTRTDWGSDWEDYLVLFGDRLDDYRAQLFANWHGQGLEFDSLSAAFDATFAGWLAAFLRDLGSEGWTVVKSPSAENLDRLMPWLLAAVDVVVVVRDPRAALQSARFTFDDSFERRLRAYVRSARAILASERMGAVLVRYEDLLSDRREQLRRVFGSVGLDEARYDFEEADRLPIRGSVTTPGEVRWQGVPSNDSFDGARRGMQLPPPLRRRVEWVAAAEMEAFDYGDRLPLRSHHKVELRGRDALYRTARKGSRIASAFVNTERFVHSATAS